MATSQSLSSSMEAISSSGLIPRFSERPCAVQSVKITADWLGSWGNLKSSLSVAHGISSPVGASRIAALPREESSGGDANEEEQNRRLNDENGFGLASEGAVSWSQVPAFHASIHLDFYLSLSELSVFVCACVYLFETACGAGFHDIICLLKCQMGKWLLKSCFDGSLMF